MSYIFDIDGDTVWSPSLLAGQVYVGLVRSLEITLQSAAGFNPVADDMMDINPAELSNFVDRLLQFETDGRHPILAAAVAPVLAISSVMLRRSPSAGDNRQALPESLRNAADRLDSDMPR